MNQLAEMADIARNTFCNGSLAWDDDEIRREIGRLQAEYDALWALTKAGGVTSPAHRDAWTGWLGVQALLRRCQEADG